MMNMWFVFFFLLTINQFIIVSAETTYSTDAFGNNFLFPQCTTFLNDGSIAVFHCNANGVNGQQGISIFNPQTNNQSKARSISFLRQKVNGPIPPVFQYRSSEWWDISPSCGTMFNMNRTINQSTIELIAFSLPSRNGSLYGSLNVLIDRDGYYYGQWSDVDRPRPILTLTINHVPRRFVVEPGNKQITSIDSNNQTTYKTMDINEFWVQTKSFGMTGPQQQTTNGFDKLFWSSVVGSTVSSSLSTITIYTFHFSVNGSTIKTQLVSSIYEPEYYSDFSNVAIGQFSLNQFDGSIIYSAPGNFWNGSPGVIIRVFPSFNYQPFVPTKGEIAEVIPGGSSFGGGIGVFHTDSAFITFNGSLLIIDKNNQMISQITELSGVTDQARTNGISSSFTGLQITSIYVDNLDRIYLTTLDISSRNYSVLILTRTGQFIDYYSGFSQISSSFVDRNSQLVIYADRKLSLYNMTTHQLVREIGISGLRGGISLDSVNGGYVISSADFMYIGDQEQYFLQFFTADYQLNTSVVQIPGYDTYLSNPVIDSEGRIFVLRQSFFPVMGAGPLVYKLQVFDPHTHQLIFETYWNLKNYKANNGIRQDHPTLAIDPNDDSLLVYSSGYRYIPSFRTVSFVDRLPQPSSCQIVCY